MYGKAYLLTNKNGMRAEVLTFGAILRSLTVPGRDGRPRSVVIGYAENEGYLDNPCYMGGAIGPVCNRTANATFVLDGAAWHLPQNEGVNNLHGDAERGFHKREWTAEEEAEERLVLTLEAPHLDLGFPGNRKFTLTYSLTEDNGLRIDWHVTSDRNTFVNPTNHPYFHLDGERGTTILHHTARFAASHFLPLREGLVPTGEIRAVQGTPFDFTKDREIGREIDADDAQLAMGQGYDHHFVIDDADGSLRPFATVTSDHAGLSMEVSTTLPGFQFYTGNYFSCPADLSGRERGAREGFCIETSYPPNAANMPSFPQPVCNEEHPFMSSTVYRFF